jgi:hypothetical protein
MTESGSKRVKRPTYPSTSPRVQVHQLQIRITHDACDVRMRWWGICCPRAGDTEIKATWRQIVHPRGVNSVDGIATRISVTVPTLGVSRPTARHIRIRGHVPSVYIRVVSLVRVVQTRRRIAPISSVAPGILRVRGALGFAPRKVCAGGAEFIHQGKARPPKY